MLPAGQSTDPQPSYSEGQSVLTPVTSAVHLSGTEISISIPSRSLIHMAAQCNQEGVTKQRCIAPQAASSELRDNVCRSGWRKRLKWSQGSLKKIIPKAFNRLCLCLDVSVRGWPWRAGELSTTRPVTAAPVTRALPTALLSSDSRHDTAGVSCLKAILSYWSWEKEMPA